MGLAIVMGQGLAKTKIRSMKVRTARRRGKVGSRSVVGGAS
jgi:hypothetical protein